MYSCWSEIWWYVTLRKKIHFKQFETSINGLHDEHASKTQKTCRRYEGEISISTALNFWTSLQWLPCKQSTTHLSHKHRKLTCLTSQLTRTLLVEEENLARKRWKSGKWDDILCSGRLEAGCHESSTREVTYMVFGVSTYGFVIDSADVGMIEDLCGRGFHTDINANPWWK